jgi:hypothetical protein
LKIDIPKFRESTKLNLRSLGLLLFKIPLTAERQTTKDTIASMPFILSKSNLLQSWIESPHAPSLRLSASIWIVIHLFTAAIFREDWKWESLFPYNQMETKQAHENDNKYTQSSQRNAGPNGDGQ